MYIFLFHISTTMVFFNLQSHPLNYCTKSSFLSLLYFPCMSLYLLDACCILYVLHPMICSLVKFYHCFCCLINSNNFVKGPVYIFWIVISCGFESLPNYNPISLIFNLWGIIQNIVFLNAFLNTCLSKPHIFLMYSFLYCGLAACYKRQCFYAYSTILLLNFLNTLSQNLTFISIFSVVYFLLFSLHPTLIPSTIS